MVVYRNSPAAARAYLEADRGRADDYYLTEETGLAERYSASPTLGVDHRGGLSGDAYEAWVAGVDPGTGIPKGRLRNSENAVRFVEITVNGPKSWSLAAAIHPDISIAYDLAQDRAAEQIIGWLAQHATTRIGPRGAQVQVPVTEIEAVTVRHYTSRAGDPHRHLHLQVNARVQAEGRWYGLHTVRVRDSLDAINGIGHAAMMTDPAFRAALAAHGFTLDLGTGEIVQMRGYVGAFSIRTKQIETNLDRYEAVWRKANPGQEPGPRLRQRWDHQAWNDARPGKIVPKDGEEINAEWLAELRALGYRDPAGPVLDLVLRPGELDREETVQTVLTRLGGRRSAWNAADIRGEIEQHLARAGVVTDAAARIELAEDLTARTLAECVLLLDRPGLPEHLRVLTSPHVVAVEADLIARLVARAMTPVAGAVSPQVVTGLDSAQREVVAALAGDSRLLVVEGAAGTGKTTTLAAARTVIEDGGHRLIVVTPTKKAAQVAATQVGTSAFSAAWLAHQHGWRWDEHGTWTRLEVGQLDRGERSRTRPYAGPTPEAALRAGDVLLVDEAGMLNQDTAHALLHVADETGARLVLVGDRHQLPAVGRGGVLDLAARFADPAARLELRTVHRFTNPDYARLSLAMRSGEHPEAVFDILAGKGLVQVHASEVERLDAMADDTARAIRSGGLVRVLADTNEQASQLNTAIRDRLVNDGQVDDQRTVMTRAGQRIGAGDVVMTRRNDTDLGVANRETWVVTAVTLDGELRVTSEQGERILPVDYARKHVQLGYASTVHGGQGETVQNAHFALGENTSAASAYVGMTRGRDANTMHIVADSIDEARELWMETFDRDRADLGPAIAAQRVAVEADRYAPQRPLADALVDLHAAWSVEADTSRQLARTTVYRDQLRQFLAARAGFDAALAPLNTARQQAAQAAQRATQHAERLTRVVETTATSYTDRLQQQWDQQRPATREPARTLLDGPGRFGIHHRRVEHAAAELGRWADRWRPVIPNLPTDPTQLAQVADRYDSPRVRTAIGAYARAAAHRAHPEHRGAVENAATATEYARQTESDYRQTATAYDHRLAGRFGGLAYRRDPSAQLDRYEGWVTEETSKHNTAVSRVRTLMSEPALRSLTPERIQTERDTWHHGRAAQQRAEQAAAQRAARRRDAAQHQHDHDPVPSYTTQSPQHDQGIGF